MKSWACEGLVSSLEGSCVRSDISLVCASRFVDMIGEDCEKGNSLTVPWKDVR